MSWLSDRLGTTGKTPSWIRAIGDTAAKAAGAFIPGAQTVIDTANRLTAGGGGGLQEVVAQTTRNVDTALGNAGAAMDAQRQTQQLTTALTSPLGMIVVILVAIALLKKG